MPRERCFFVFFFFLFCKEMQRERKVNYTMGDGVNYFLSTRRFFYRQIVPIWDLLVIDVGEKAAGGISSQASLLVC